MARSEAAKERNRIASRNYMRAKLATVEGREELAERSRVTRSTEEGLLESRRLALTSSRKRYQRIKGSSEERRRKREYSRRRRKEPAVRVLHSLRNRLSVLVRANKAAHTVELIGCTPAELCEHLERQFQPGMTWDNYGEWHVDHRRSCASFNMLDPDQQRKCFHYTNLQPLWAADNIRKGG